MQYIPAPSLKVGDVIAVTRNGVEVHKRIVAITERPRLDRSERSIYFKLEGDRQVINWRKSRHGHLKAKLVSEAV
jgi:hypothetical protein